MTQITRVWTRKDETTPVGSAVLTFPDGAWSLRIVGGDGKTIAETKDVTEVIRLALGEQALSPLTDTYTRTGPLATAQAEFADKGTRLVNGEYKTRSGGSGVDPITAEIRKIVTALVKAADEKRTQKAWPLLDAMSPADRNDSLDERFAKQPEAVRADLTAKAKATIKARVAEAAKRKASKDALAEVAGGF